MKRGAFAVPAKGSDTMDFGLLLPLVLLVPLLLITFRARRQQRAFSDLQASLRPGQRVMTTAGLHATIVELQDDVAVLDVADGVRLRWARAAIGQVLDAAPAEADEPAADRPAADRPAADTSPETPPEKPGPS